MIKVFSLLFFVYLFLYNSTACAEGKGLKLAYLETGLQDLNDAERRTGLEILAGELSKGIDTDFTVASYKNVEALIDALMAGEINFAVLNSYYFIRETERLQPFLGKDLYAIRRSHLPKEDYMVVAKKDLNYKNISSLAGKRVSLRKDYLIQVFYLEYLIKKYAHSSLEGFFKTVKDTRSDSQSVLDVFFDTSDATMVPEYVFDLVVELNPAVRERVNVVHRSGAHFIPAVVFVTKDTAENFADIVKKNLHDLPNNARGQEILNLFGIEAIDRIENVELNEMLKIYDEYQSL